MCRATENRSLTRSFFHSQNRINGQKGVMGVPIRPGPDLNRILPFSWWFGCFWSVGSLQSSLLHSRFEDREPETVRVCGVGRGMLLRTLTSFYVKYCSCIYMAWKICVLLGRMEFWEEMYSSVGKIFSKRPRSTAAEHFLFPLLPARCSSLR